jgi:hypothetical protein
MGFHMFNLKLMLNDARSIQSRWPHPSYQIAVCLFVIFCQPAA